MANGILNKLDTLLGNRNNDGLYGNKPLFEEEMFERMFGLLTSLDPEQLSEEQAGEVMSIVEDVELEYDGIDEEELDEIQRVRHDVVGLRKERKYYRKNKAALRREALRYKKSSRGRLMAKKAAKMAKLGKTATGRRKRMYY
jgi:hypothetical protein